MRIALDTNVVSELVKPHTDGQVLSWSSILRTEDLYLPAMCWAELQRGIRLLPRGRRRDRLEQAVGEFAASVGGFLPFGRAEAEAYAELASEPGRPRSVLDAMIAATCRTAGFPLATRNTRDFHGCGVELIDPWAPA